MACRNDIIYECRLSRKAVIIEGKKDRIYEVAEKVDYGSNSQYFSQVFKKYTGVSPLEYREFARLAREKNEAG